MSQRDIEGDIRFSLKAAAEQSLLMSAFSQKRTFGQHRVRQRAFRLRAEGLPNAERCG
jgi:hypothetical protein